MSRSKGLSRRLRELKGELSRVSDLKIEYDYDVQRAVAALGVYDLKLKRAAGSPDVSVPVENDSKPDPSPATGQPSIEDGGVDETQFPSWAKKLFRHIAHCAHPDKTAVDKSVSEERRKELTEAYIEANAHYRSGKFELLIEIALELDIPIDSDEESLQPALESRISQVSKDIECAKSTVSWAWGSSFGDIAKRITVLKRCASIMGTDCPPDSVLEEMVRELERTYDFDVTSSLRSIRRIRIDSVKRKPGQAPVRRLKDS